MKLLIVNYHYFREEKYKSGIYPISTKEFQEQLEYLNKKYKLISQLELGNIMKSKTNYNDNFALITFDDGLSEQMKAYDIMVKNGVPGIFYVTTDPIKNNKCVDVHKLHYIRSKFDDIEIFNKLSQSYSIDKFNFNMNTVQAQYKYDDELSQKIKYFINFILDMKQRRNFVDNMFSSLVENENEFSKMLYMSQDDIVKLSTNDMLGTHSASHQALAGLNDFGIYNDIKSSLDFFKSIGINNIPSISYPYGGFTAVNDIVIEISKKFGFHFGLTMFRGVNNFEDILENRMLLKRISCSDLVLT